MNTYYLTRPRHRPPIEPTDTGHIGMRVLPHHHEGAIAMPQRPRIDPALGLDLWPTAH